MSFSMDGNFYPVLAVLSINFIFTIFYIFIIINEKRKQVFFGMPRLIQKSFVLFFVLPLVSAPVMEQPAIVASDLLPRITGALIALAGLTIIMLAFLKIGSVPGIKQKSEVVSTGIYGIVRHPIYSGTIFLFLGVILFFNALIALCYFPVSVALYYTMTVFEEKDLIVLYGDNYRGYRDRVRKRLIPYVL